MVRINYRFQRYENVFDSPVYYDDDQLIKRFRFNSNSIRRLTELIENDMPALQNGQRGRPIPIHVQVCGTLRYLASNDFQCGIADTLRISQAAVSRSVHNVVNALSNHIGEFVVFPTGVEHIQIMKQDFWRTVCAMLHNFAIDQGIPDADDDFPEDYEQPDVLPRGDDEGLTYRERFAEAHF